MRSCAIFETELADRHLASLCRHFGRKVETICIDGTGVIRFGFGQCEMTADSHQLAFVVTADDQPHLDEVVQIVSSHLDRFAFRENPELNWKVDTK